MTQEDKELLLQDLCARLSYGVYISPADCGKAILIGIKDGNPLLWDTILKKEYDKPWDIEYIKPYLRPMSSMTEEEKHKLYQVFQECPTIIRTFPSYAEFFVYADIINSIDMVNVIDWLNANHFDYHGLIEKGIALEAPKGMYKE